MRGIQRVLVPSHAKLIHCGNRALYDALKNDALFPNLMEPQSLDLCRACKYFSCGDDCKIAQVNNLSIYSPAKRVGMAVNHDRVGGSLIVDQDAFIVKLLADNNMSDCNPSKTPAAPGSKLEKLAPGEKEILDSNLAKLAGSCLLLSRCTVPEISYATDQVAAHVRQPGERRLLAGKRILRYLKGRLGKGITLWRQQEIKLVSAFDADFVGEPEANEKPKRSTSGQYYYGKGVGKLFAVSNPQATMARSTATSENRLVADGLSRTDGFRFALEELGFPQGVTDILEDNEACIARSFRVVSGMKDRHEFMDHHYVRQFTQSGDVVYRHIPSADMIADLFTKAFSVGQFGKLRDWIIEGTVV